MAIGIAEQKAASCVNLFNLSSTSVGSRYQRERGGGVYRKDIKVKDVHVS